jgi:endonuclease-3
VPRSYPLTEMLLRIEEAIQSFPKAAMFDLAERGYSSLFEQLVSCVISIRTLDETTIPVSLRLFAEARTPREVTNLGRERLAELLYGSTFPGQKADTILAVAEAALQAKGGQLPANFDALTAIKGIGPKCANLALGVASGLAGISVDIHVHRVVNRWGMVETKTPEATLKILEDIVPKEQWIDINRLLMPFGKFICTGPLPHCSTCPVYEWCERRGVTRHR